MLFKTRREINIKHRGESLVYFSARILTFGNRKDLGNVSWAIETKTFTESGFLDVKLVESHRQLTSAIVWPFQ